MDDIRYGYRCDKIQLFTNTISGRYKLEVTVTSPAANSGGIHVFRTAVTIKMKVTDTLYGVIPRFKKNIALQNGDSDVGTLVLTARACCEHCPDESLLPVAPPPPNQLAERCFPRDLTLVPDRGVDINSPLAVLEETSDQCTAQVKFLIPENPRRPLPHQKTCRCANQTLKFVSSLSRKRC